MERNDNEVGFGVVCNVRCSTTAQSDPPDLSIIRPVLGLHNANGSIKVTFESASLITPNACGTFRSRRNQST